MSKASALGAALYSIESTFGEDVAAPAIRMPILDAVDLSGLSHAKLAPGRTVQYLNDDTAHISGVQGGSFRTRFYLTGHGGVTSGATPLTSLATLLQYVLGAAVAGASGSTFTGGTATVPTTTSSGTFSAGSLCRAGVFGDTRGGGQFHAIATHVTTTMTLLTGTAVAVNAADVLHSAELVHSLELPSSLAAVTGISWRLHTANLQVDCHGCYATGLTINLPVDGTLPTVDITWAASWWEYGTATFPSATSMEEFVPAPAGPSGSVFLNAKGTATRALRTVTGLTVTIATNIQPVIAPGGVGQYQACVGARRTPMDIMVEWEEEAPAASATPQSDTDWDEQKHMLYTLNSVAGRAVGVYFPRLTPAGERPSQNANNGMNRQMRRFKATTGDTKTTDLTASAIRLGLA